MFGKNKKMGLGSFHKGLLCGVVVSSCKEDDGFEEPIIASEDWLSYSSFA